MAKVQWPGGGGGGTITRYKKRREVWPRMPWESVEEWRSRIADEAVSRVSGINGPEVRRRHKGAGRLPRTKRR